MPSPDCCSRERPVCESRASLDWSRIVSRLLEEGESMELAMRSAIVRVHGFADDGSEDGKQRPSRVR